jgi:vitamin B12 transporter
MHRLRILAGAFFVLALPPLVASAQDTAPRPAPAPSTTPLRDIGSVTTTADRHSEPLVRSARPTYIVTADEIRRRGAETVADALKFVPGISVLPYGGIGQSAPIRLPGSNESNDVLILIDGFPIQNSYTGTVDLGTLTTAGIERIEVVQGGASALYGSSAVAGVVNIITGGPTDTPYAAISTGSFATNRLALADATKIGANGTLNAAFQRETAGNAYSYPAASTYGSNSGFVSGTRQNAYGQLSNGLLTYSDKLGSRFLLHGIAYLNDQHNGVPNGLSSTPLTDFSSSERGTTRLFGASAEHNAGPMKTTLAVSESRDTLYFTDVDAGTPSDTTAVDRTDISLRNLLELHKSRILTGAETSIASVSEGSTGQFAANVGARQSRNALFAQYEHDIASTGRVYGGLRLEHDSPQGHTFAPSVGATIPVGMFRVAANASTAFRAPTLTELYFPGFGNPDLLPERSHNADFTFSAPSIGGGVSARIFSRKASNLIQSLPVAPFTASNIAHASFQGLVLSASTKPYRHVAFSTTYTDTYKADDTSSSTPTRLLYVPQTINSFTFERLPEGNSLSYGVTGSLYSASQQFSGTAPAWTSLDAYLRVPISPGAIMTLHSRNFANEAYETDAGYPMPGRSFEVELATR